MHILINSLILFYQETAKTFLEFIVAEQNYIY